jgi:hypothetical protein
MHAGIEPLCVLDYNHTLECKIVHRNNVKVYKIAYNDGKLSRMIIAAKIKVFEDVQRSDACGY